MLLFLVSPTIFTLLISHGERTSFLSDFKTHLCVAILFGFVFGLHVSLCTPPIYRRESKLPLDDTLLCMIVYAVEAGFIGSLTSALYAAAREYFARFTRDSDSKHASSADAVPAESPSHPKEENIESQPNETRSPSWNWFGNLVCASVTIGVLFLIFHFSKVYINRSNSLIALLLLPPLFGAIYGTLRRGGRGLLQGIFYGVLLIPLYVFILVMISVSGYQWARLSLP